MTNAEAIERTVASLRDSEADAALVQLARSLAAAVDASPGRAALAKEYREALVELARRSEAVDDGLGAALAALSAAPMGDAADAVAPDARR